MGSKKILLQNGSKERSQGRLKSPCKSSKEERRWRRRKGQKEEVVQGKNPRQIEQLGLVRQAYLRQTVERSSNLQTITPSIVSERLKVRGSLARKALHELAQKGLIKQV